MLILGLASALALAPASSIDEAPTAAVPIAASEDEATGDEPTVPLVDALVVRPGATCLDRDRLVTQIRTWFDRERIDARLVVDVVGDEKDAHKLAFSIRRAERVIAVRRFEPAPERCADLHAVVGLAIALAIDATLLETVAGNPTRPPDPPPRPPDLEPEPEPKPPPPRKERLWRLGAELTAMLTLGAPPDVGGGARFALRTSWRRIVDLRLGAFAASSGRERIGEGSASFSAVAGRFDLCAGPPWIRVRPRGCVGVLAGAAFSAGQGFDDDNNVRVPWVALPFGVDLEVRLAPRVGLLVGLDGVPTLLRPVFDARSSQGDVYVRRFARFGAAVELGLAFSLW